MNCKGSAPFYASLRFQSSAKTLTDRLEIVKDILIISVPTLTLADVDILTQNVTRLTWHANVLKTEECLFIGEK